MSQQEGAACRVARHDLSVLPPELRAAFAAERARRLALEADVAALAEHNRRLEHLVAEFRQVLYAWIVWLRRVSCRNGVHFRITLGGPEEG